MKDKYEGRIMMSAQRCFLLVATLAVAACDSGEAPSTTVRADEPFATVSGVVADGYLVGAHVCLDLNENLYCDAGDPADTTVAGGRYALALNAAQAQLLATRHVLAEVPGTAVDQDTGEAVGGNFTMSAPKGDYQVINPITTLVVEQMRQSLQSRDAALAEVAARLQSSEPQQLLADYAVADATAEQRVLHNVARVLTQLMVRMTADAELALGGQAVSSRRHLVHAMVGAHALRNAAAIRNQIDADMTAEEIQAVAVPAIPVDATTIDRQLLDAEFIASRDVEVPLSFGLCWITNAEGYQFNAKCNYVVDGMFENRYWEATPASYYYDYPSYYEYRSSDVVDVSVGGAWVRHDRARMPVVIEGTSVAFNTPIGQESWEVTSLNVSGRRINDIVRPLGSPVHVSDERVFPEGAWVFRVERTYSYLAHIASGRAPADGFPPVTSIDDVVAHFSAGNEADDWATYYSYTDTYCTICWSEISQMQFGGNNSLLRLYNYDFLLANGTWSMEEFLGQRLLRAFDDGGDLLMSILVRDGSAYSVSSVPAESGEQVAYRFNKIAFNELK